MEEAGAQTHWIRRFGVVPVVFFVSNVAGKSPVTWSFLSEHILVGVLVAILYFPINIGNVIIPIDFHIFQRGGPTTNQIRKYMGHDGKITIHLNGSKWWILQFATFDEPEGKSPPKWGCALPCRRIPLGIHGKARKPALSIAKSVCRSSSAKVPWLPYNVTLQYVALYTQFMNYRSTINL